MSELKELNSNGSFINDCLNAEATLEDLNDYIDYWHENDTGDTLQEFLGLTDKEYEQWRKQTNDKEFFSAVLENRYNGEKFIKTKNAWDIKAEEIAEMKKSGISFLDVEKEEAKKAFEKGWQVFINYKPVTDIEEINGADSGFSINEDERNEKRGKFKGTYKVGNIKLEKTEDGNRLDFSEATFTPAFETEVKLESANEISVLEEIYNRIKKTEVDYTLEELQSLYVNLYENETELRVNDERVFLSESEKASLMESLDFEYTEFEYEATPVFPKTPLPKEEPIISEAEVALVEEVADIVERMATERESPDYFLSVGFQTYILDEVGEKKASNFVDDYKDIIEFEKEFKVVQIKLNAELSELNKVGITLNVDDSVEVFNKKLEELQNRFSKALAEHAEKGTEETKETLHELQEAKKYLKDIYEDVLDYKALEEEFYINKGVFLEDFDNLLDGYKVYEKESVKNSVREAFIENFGDVPLILDNLDVFTKDELKASFYDNESVLADWIDDYKNILERKEELSIDFENLYSDYLKYSDDLEKHGKMVEKFNKKIDDFVASRTEAVKEDVQEEKAKPEKETKKKSKDDMER